MIRLGDGDIVDRLAPLPAWASEILFALACAGATVLVRVAVDVAAPGSGPYSLMYPAVMVATLFGRWRSGLLTLAIMVLLVWYFLLPPSGSFALADPANVSRSVVNGLAGLAVVALADLSRRAFRQAVRERNARIEELGLLMREIDHRMKNNFSIVLSMLSLQRRQSDDPATKEALAAARARVESIARAHNWLYAGEGSLAEVEMTRYLPELCAELERALFSGRDIKLDCHADAITMPRDRAVLVGLIVNELVTNAAKHAFEGRLGGEVRVALEKHAGGTRLIVSDDGIGLPEAVREGALGQRLLQAFSEQAGGTLASRAGETGSVFTLTLPA